MADGSYYYDGGYYDSPRAFDYAVEQRAVYSSTYYYPEGYPYRWGGYGRPYYYDHRPDRDDHHHDDHDGPGRTRERDLDRSTASHRPDVTPDQSAREGVTHQNRIDTNAHPDGGSGHRGSAGRSGHR